MKPSLVSIIATKVLYKIFNFQIIIQKLFKQLQVPPLFWFIFPIFGVHKNVSSL